MHGLRLPQNLVGWLTPMAGLILKTEVHIGPFRYIAVHGHHSLAQLLNTILCNDK